MVTIEQVRLLEQKVTKAIDYVTRVSEENTLLKTRMESYQKRVDELEILIQRFKEEQSRIEESIVASLDKLNRFESSVDHAAYEGDSAFTTVETVTAASVSTESAVPPLDDELEEELDDAIAALSETAPVTAEEPAVSESSGGEGSGASGDGASGDSADGGMTGGDLNIF